MLNSFWLTAWAECNVLNRRFELALFSAEFRGSCGETANLALIRRALGLPTRRNRPRSPTMNATYVDKVRALRRARKLHEVAAKRLCELLRVAFPDAATIPEVSAVLGGRNDLLQFFF